MVLRHSQLKDTQGKISLISSVLIAEGHGKSEGKFEEFTISDWRKDLLDIIDNIAKGPQILIGSSMGGWLMMLAAKARPKRIKGMIGLAAAPDFGKDLYNNLNKKNKREITSKGITKYTSYGF
jgi:alpha-beta hydrolase superfamily lysophospholipase